LPFSLLPESLSLNLLGRPKGTGKSKLDKFKPEIEALLLNGSTQKLALVKNKWVSALVKNKWVKTH
jgi:hypothetical protein